MLISSFFINKIKRIMLICVKHVYYGAWKTVHASQFFVTIHYRIQICYEMCSVLMGLHIKSNYYKSLSVRDYQNNSLAKCERKQ